MEKKLVTDSVNLYWSLKLKDEVNSKTTLKYLNADDVMIGKTIYGIVVVLNPMLSTDHVSKRS